MAATKEQTIIFNDTININKFKVPKTLKYFDIEGSVNHSWPEKDKLPELTKYNTKELWLDRLKKGKLVSINDPIIGGIDNIADGYTDIRQCLGWKLVRIESALVNGIIFPPVVAKRKNEVLFIDGRTTACLLHEFKTENQMVWVIDTKEDEEDVVLKAPDRIEDMIPVFDYGNIKPEHQALVRDILQRIDNNKQPEDIKNDLSVLFKLQGENEFDLEKSIFIKYAKRVNLVPTKQGHITVKDGDKKPINYPIMSICDDIRKLDELVEEIMKDVMLKAREIQNNGSK